MHRLCVYIKYILAGLLVFSSPAVYSQFFSRGTDPASLKWNQIRTDHFRVIFPEDFTEEAGRFTRILELQYEASSDQLGHRPRPVPVIIHNHSARSNGWVAWAPKRMEILSTPAANSYSQDALEHLALHEFRHVVQVDKLNQGFTRFLRVPLGQGGMGAVAGLLPFWFLEGDAVYAETHLSLAGRGRQPSWEMDLRALLADETKDFSYEKSVMGSYRDYVPDHYRFGYQMVSYARARYGDGIWDSLVDYTARRPYTLYPFYFGLKKYAGTSKSGLYRETMDTLAACWEKQSGSMVLTGSRRINNGDKKHFTSYRFTEYLDDGSVFAEKSGIDQIPEFVRIDSGGKETRIYRPGFYNPATISVEGKMAAWTEIIGDIRWDHRSYSVVKLLNMANGVETNLGLKTRYFAPDLARDSNRVAVIEADVQNRYFLVIIDAWSGKVEMKIPSPGNDFLQYPAWNHAQDGLFMTALGEKGKRIVFHDLASGTWQDVFDAGYQDIAELDAGKDFLVFRGGFNGIDNIYAIRLEDNECFRVTLSRFGAFFPALSAKGDKLIFSDYTSQGYDACEMDFVPDELIPFVPGGVNDIQKYRSADSLQEWVLEENRESRQSYEVTQFRKVTDLLNPHTWIPFYTDIEDPDFLDPKVSPGFMLFSQNKLSTATATIGYEYREQDHFVHASFTYEGLYPVIRFSYDFGGYPFVARPPDGIDPPARVRTNANLNAGIHLPLNLTMNRYVTGIRPSAEARFNHSYFYYDSEPAGYRPGLTFMEYGLFFYNYLKTSTRDILPRFGQIIDLRYINTPFEEEQVGTQLFVAASLYLPGLLPHHTLKLTASGQKQEPARYLMSNMVGMPRGFDRQTAVQLRKFSADYIFPVWYPDMNVWHAAYFKRLKGGLFFDHATGNEVYIQGSDNGPVDRTFTSLGGELTTDVHLAHLIFPLEMGVQVIYRPVEDDLMAKFILSVDLNRF